MNTCYQYHAQKSIYLPDFSCIPNLTGTGTEHTSIDICTSFQGLDMFHTRNDAAKYGGVSVQITLCIADNNIQLCST